MSTSMDQDQFDLWILKKLALKDKDVPVVLAAMNADRKKAGLTPLVERKFGVGDSWADDSDSEE